MHADLLIRNARTRASGADAVDIAIQDGRIAEIGPRLDARSRAVLDAAGRLVTESFVNPHLHLCKAYTLPMAAQDALTCYHGGTMGAAMTAIELASRVKERYAEDWIVGNARRAAALALRYGNTHIRAFADTDSKARLEGVKALLRVREEMKGRVELQVVAFPQDGVVRDPEAERYVKEAVELGADVVGGIPWIEYTEADSREHIDRMFAIARRHDRHVSMLIDDAGDAGLRTLEMLAVKTIAEGWEGRVTAHHCRAMALYPEPYFRKVAALLERARIGVVSDPHTGPLHARVRDLLGLGVTVALGQDDVADAYYPFGRNNMLEVAFLAAHLLWMTTFADLEMLYDMITTRAASIMGLPDHRLAKGGSADLVVLDAPTVWEAIRDHEPPVAVIRDGRVVTPAAQAAATDRRRPVAGVSRG